MDLFSSHEFAAHPGDVATAMLDPAFYAGLALPDIEPPVVLERHVQAEVVTMRVQYAYTGTLDPIARTVLGTERITWVQELTYDLTSQRGDLVIVPGVQAGRVSCRGAIGITSLEEGSKRTITGELKIAIPLVGGRAEKAIAPGILRRLDLESAALAAYLGE